MGTFSLIVFAYHVMLVKVPRSYQPFDCLVGVISEDGAMNTGTGALGWATLSKNQNLPIFLFNTIWNYYYESLPFVSFTCLDPQNPFLSPAVWITIITTPSLVNTGDNTSRTPTHKIGSVYLKHLA